MEERWANMAFDVAIGERSAQSMASEIVGHYASLEAQLAEAKRELRELIPMASMRAAVRAIHERDKQLAHERRKVSVLADEVKNRSRFLSTKEEWLEWADEKAKEAK